jgi:hypothetical protein
MCELRKRGLTTAVIVSGPFLGLGKNQSRVFGVPDLPLLLIPHPLGGLSLEQVEGRAQHAIPQVVSLIRSHLGGSGIGNRE